MTHPGTPGSADAPRQPLADPAPGRPPAESSVPGGEEPDGGDEFACFYREHVGRLVAYLFYQGATAPLAADIAQDAMITAYRRWSAITSPRAYVYKVAYKAFLRHVLDAPELPVGEVPEPPVLLPRPEEAEAWLQTQQIIQVLRALPPRQRQVLALTIDGWTPAEMAEMLGIDPAAVRSSLRKARRAAGEHLRRIGEEAP
jgi:RNA polymerase sigma factor (sigma-70 family)